MGKKGNFPLLTFFLLSILISLPFTTFSKSEDSETMADFTKSLTNLPLSWKSSSDPCNPAWSGVRCDSSGRVIDINLSRLSISGSLPDSVSGLSSLKSLQLQGNSITGAVPSLSSLSSLERLVLDSNSFSSLPSDFPSGLTSLQYLSIDDNPFAPWNLPSALTPPSSLSTLTSFSASNASISGPFPPLLTSLPNLLSLRLSYNNLTGELPASLAGSSIQSLSLNNQKSPSKLTGRIDVLASMPQLTLVWLQSNSFTGPIPDLSNLTSLLSFNVRDNDLTGLVPPSLTSLTTLQNVSLSNNKLQGPFPSFPPRVTADVDSGNYFCNTSPGPCDTRVTILLAVAAGFNYPTELADSWQGNNPCGGDGWIGVTCDASGKSITVLNFANHNFSGVISPSLANLTSLTKIILSNNRLTGSIPESLTTLPQLQLLDVSNNGLTGMVPVFPSSVSVKASGNRFGQSDSGSGSDGGANSSDGSSGSTGSSSGGDQSGKSKSSIGMIIGVIIGILAIIGCSVFLLMWFRRNKNAKKLGSVPARNGNLNSEQGGMVKIRVPGTGGNNGNSNNGLTELYSHQSTLTSPNTHNMFDGMQMSIQSLIRTTDNFSESNILGRGGFGVVYKGNHNGTLIAVKRSEGDPMGKKGLQEFRAEIDVLTKVRHRNLVALLGYCENGSERLLVYEYMPGGTLGQHLFDWAESKYPPLTWKQRLTIALDVARGIEYLHSLAQETFIHRDLKPSNILLDKDWRAKVSDFGLVKLAADREKSVMTRLAGTFGYLAPEYAITGKVSTKVDVYAFGVILMEIITGRKVLDDTLPDSESHLVACFRRNILDKDKFMKSVDPTLDLSDPESREALLEVADLARHCTAREPFQRPDMSHCVNRLAPLVDQWKPSTGEDQDDEDYDGESSSMGLNQRLQKWKSTDNSSTTELFDTTFG